ncbi:MAG TPA: hypothetical protein PLQ12_07185 [Candidatus Defluviicoccus seviourii]|nr:hypothetical protein [Candidatus Defluviicoccus seviourii]
MNVQIPYLVAKRRRGSVAVAYYWQPSRELRASGWRALRLPDDLGAAEAAARARNAEVTDWRAGGRQAHPGVGAGTVAALVSAYLASQNFRALAPRTSKDYRHYLDELVTAAGGLAAASLRPELLERRHDEWAATAPAAAAYFLRVCRIVFDWGRKRGLVVRNPAAALKVRQARPGMRSIWTAATLGQFVAAADKIGRPSIGTAALLAYWWGQREGDILALRPADVSDSVMRCRQRKTGVDVVLPIDLVPGLRQRLAQHVCSPQSSGCLGAAGNAALIASEATGRPYTARHFARLVEDVRCAASAAATAEGDLDSAAALATLQFQRLRATAVVRLLEAGCDGLLVSAVTGHSPRSVDLIARHYLVRTEALTALAVGRRREVEA